MKFFAVTLFSTINAQACEWKKGNSGQNIRCDPDWYIRGGCESGSALDCRVNGNKAAFGVKCCPADRNVPLTNRREDDCTWTMLNS